MNLLPYVRGIYEPFLFINIQFNLSPLRLLLFIRFYFAIYAFIFSVTSVSIVLRIQLGLWFSHCNWGFFCTLFEHTLLHEYDSVNGLSMNSCTLSHLSHYFLFFPFLSSPVSLFPTMCPQVVELSDLKQYLATLK